MSEWTKESVDNRPHENILSKESLLTFQGNERRDCYRSISAFHSWCMTVFASNLLTYLCLTEEKELAGWKEAKKGSLQSQHPGVARMPKIHGSCRHCTLVWAWTIWPGLLTRRPLAGLQGQGIKEPRCNVLEPEGWNASWARRISPIPTSLSVSLCLGNAVMRS